MRHGWRNDARIRYSFDLRWKNSWIPHLRLTDHVSSISLHNYSTFVWSVISTSSRLPFPLCRGVFCNFHRRLAHQHTRCPDANARQHRHNIQSNHSDQIKLNTSRNHSLQSIFTVLCCRFIALFLNRLVLLPFFNESLVFYANAVQCTMHSVCRRQATPTPSTRTHIPQSSFSHGTNKIDNVCIRLFAFTRTPHTARRTHDLRNWHHQHKPFYIRSEKSPHISKYLTDTIDTDIHSRALVVFRHVSSDSSSISKWVRWRRLRADNVRKKDTKNWYACFRVLSATFFPVVRTTNWYSLHPVNCGRVEIPAYRCMGLHWLRAKCIVESGIRGSRSAYHSTIRIKSIELHQQILMLGSYNIFYFNCSRKRE